MSDEFKVIPGLIILGMCVVAAYFVIPGSWNTIGIVQCQVTKQDANGPFGGHFYELTCTNGYKYSNVAEQLANQCGARVGDTVIVTLYKYPTTPNPIITQDLTEDSGC